MVARGIRSLALAAFAACASPSKPAAPEPPQAPESAIEVKGSSGPPGTLIVLNKSDATASLLSRSDGRKLALVGVGEGPHEVAVTPDGKTAVVCNYGKRGAPGNTLSVLDVASGRAVRTIDLGEYERPHGIQFLPDGRRFLVTVEAQKAMVVVDLEKGVEKAISTDQEISHMLVASPEGRFAYVANIGSGSVSVLDLEAGKSIATIPTGEGAEGIDVTPDGGEVWVTNRGADNVSVIDASTLQIAATLPSATFPIRIKITPDGKHALVSNARSGDIAVFDVKDRKEVRRIAMTAPAVNDRKGRLFQDFEGSPVPIGILIPPDAKHAYVASAQADVVTVIDLRTWKIADRYTAGREPDGLGYSPLTTSPAK